MGELSLVCLPTHAGAGRTSGYVRWGFDLSECGQTQRIHEENLNPIVISTLSRLASVLQFTSRRTRKMSSTITSTNLEKVLEDYRIVLTGSDTPCQQTSTNVHTNPPGWPTDNFRIPDYRPINKNLDAEERPNGSHVIEKAFLRIMFTGVFINAVSELKCLAVMFCAEARLTFYLESLAKLWRATGESYFPGLFIYAIGGEW